MSRKTLLLNLSFKSLASRKLSTVLVILSLALSTMLILGVYKIKHSAKASFSRSISGTDLIVGARSGQIQLLLYTVFRKGQPVANMSYDAIEALQSLPEVDWLVPISLGDSHRGYAVLATNQAYFKHYKVGQKQDLVLAEGRIFKTKNEVVLGAEVAKKYQYKVGQNIYLSHGMATGGKLHKNQTFNIVGILKATATPVDKTLHINLQAMAALHQQDQLTSVTACLLGLHSKFAIFKLQRQINTWQSEALMAIIPGLALAELWRLMSVVDQAFWLISLLVLLITGIGLVTVLLMSLQQRQRECRILRALGASPLDLCCLMVLEALIVTGSAVLLGVAAMMGLGQMIAPVLESKFGLVLSLSQLGQYEVFILLAMMGFAVVVSLFPAYLAYKKGKQQGFESL
eukprot:COSAG01_NODE_2642_length_7323_cov_13.197121_2_plen_401_part_00